MVQGIPYEVKIEQITSAAIAARNITPPPAPKKGRKGAELPPPLYK